MSLDKLINLHLKPSDTIGNRRLITNAAGYFIKAASTYLDTDSKETFYDVPYDRITDIVFREDFSDFEKSELDELKTAVSERIGEILLAKGIPEQLINKIKQYKTEEDGENINTICIKHTQACYRKFVGHLGLAVIQKNFILDSAREANKKAHEAITKAENAKELTDRLIQNTENSTTQYISILGVFAAIIAALFGGMNLIRGAVDLLENNGSLMVLALVISLLLTCFSILIILLTNWINSIKYPNLVEKYNSVLKWTIGLLMLFSLVMGLAVYNHREDISKLAKTKIEDVRTKKTPQ